VSSVVRVWGVKVIGVVTGDCVLDQGERVGWRTGRKLEVPEAEEEHVNVRESGMMTLVTRDVL